MASRQTIADGADAADAADAETIDSTKVGRSLTGGRRGPRPLPRGLNYRVAKRCGSYGGRDGNDEGAGNV
jgi:hypothetical protein